MSQTPSTEQSVETLKTYIRAWASNDKALLLSIFADDCVLEDPVGTPAFAGHAGLSRFWDFAHQGDDRQLTPVLEEIRANGDQAVMRFTMQVRAPAINAGIDLSIMEHIQFAPDGRIAHLRAFWNEANVGKPDGMDFLVPDIEQAYQD